MPYARYRNTPAPGAGRRESNASRPRRAPNRRGRHPARRCRGEEQAVLGVFEQPKEVLAEHHIGHDAGRVRHLLGEMERREDVRMLQTGDCLDFALKAFRAERLGQPGVQHFERDGSLAPEVDARKTVALPPRSSSRSIRYRSAKPA